MAFVDKLRSWPAAFRAPGAGPGAAPGAADGHETWSSRTGGTAGGREAPHGGGERVVGKDLEKAMGNSDNGLEMVGVQFSNIEVVVYSRA